MKITTKQFHDYLISLGLFRWSIEYDGSGMVAVLSLDDKPKLENFTQIATTAYGAPVVRLSSKDYFNDRITNGYFSNQKSEAMKVWVAQQYEYNTKTMMYSPTEDIKVFFTKGDKEYFVSCLKEVWSNDGTIKVEEQGDRECITINCPSLQVGKLRYVIRPFIHGER